MKEKNIELSIKLFVREIEKINEERNEYETLNFNECIEDAFQILNEYYKGNAIEELGSLFDDLTYYQISEYDEYTREVYVPFELLD